MARMARKETVVALAPTHLTAPLFGLAAISTMACCLLSSWQEGQGSGAFTPYPVPWRKQHLPFPGGTSDSQGTLPSSYKYI